ncbi:MAG: glycoside hydrolase [Myroides sp.]|nr:glycoside hydrolase [Myroides sp.]
MNKVINYIGIFTMLIACSDNDPTAPESNADVTKSITIQTQSTYQAIEGFAASDCWAANYVGNYWSEPQKKQIARLLFSTAIQEGKPSGIGLSMWRFNLGAGTAEQGNLSGIEDISRRAECFLDETGIYDWNKHKGQQYFIEQARDYGCQSFVLFSNSPPVYYTHNGKGFSQRGAYSNLKEEHYNDFASYMADVIQYFSVYKGITFNYISPVNEPQYNWEGGQEGSGWQNSEIKKLVTSLDQALTEKNLTSKILITESGDWEYLYRGKDDINRSNQMEVFFDTQSIHYIGNLAHVDRLIGGHSYWTDSNWATMSRIRSDLSKKAISYGLKIFQTEWSMLGDNYNDKEYPGHDQATELDIALHMSKVIHHDLTTAGVSSWSFWTSMDVSRWNHKNRFLLINLVPAGGPYGDITESGQHEATKSLWALGNYSLLIRPGFKRVELTIANPSNSFFGSAWLSPDQSQLVMVYTNMTSKSIALDLEIQGLGSNAKITRYTTSATSDLNTESNISKYPVVEPRSITTFLLEY